MQDGFFMGGADAPVDVLDELNQDAHDQVQAELPPSEAQMVYLHQTKPWVPNFRSILIAPLKSGLDEFFAAQVFNWEGFDWYFPSIQWWVAHAKTSHPPRGRGCDVKSHVDFLTPDGQDAEFAYANVLADGNAYILNQADFEEECEFWKNFGPLGPHSSMYA